MLRPMITRAKTFYRAVSSFLRHGDASLGEYLHRQATCTGSGQATRRCERMAATETGLFCDACGCPRWSVSDLRTKWRMPDAACPLGKW